VATFTTVPYFVAANRVHINGRVQVLVGSLRQLQPWIVPMHCSPCCLLCGRIIDTQQWMKLCTPKYAQGIMTSHLLTIMTIRYSAIELVVVDF
jgi:hypothetical protein